MRRRDKEVTDIQEIERIIKKANCCRLGLVDNDEPYIVPVCFGYERGSLYFHGALEGRKVELIRENNKVCFEIDVDVEVVKPGKSPCGWTMRYKSVIGVGRAYILEKDEEKSRALNLTMKHYSEGEFSISKSALDSVLVVKVDIESITGKQSGY